MQIDKDPVREVNRSLAALLERALTLHNDCKFWLDLHAGDGDECCPCPWCSRDGGGASSVVYEALTGMSWALSMSASCVDSVIYRREPSVKSRLKLFGEG
jgi:hypothetical protein